MKIRIRDLSENRVFRYEVNTENQIDKMLEDIKRNIEAYKIRGREYYLELFLRKEPPILFCGTLEELRELVQNRLCDGNGLQMLEGNKYGA